MTTIGEFVFRNMRSSDSIRKIAFVDECDVPPTKSDASGKPRSGDFHRAELSDGGRELEILFEDHWLTHDPDNCATLRELAEPYGWAASDH